MKKNINDSIVIKELKFSYGDNIVLNDIGISLQKGKFYSIIGPNGSGKTTLAKYIAKLVDVEGEKVFVDGEDIKKMNAKGIAKKISCVPQNTSIDYDFSVMDIVLMGRAPYMGRFQSESESDIQIAKRAMDITKVWHLKDKKINQISGGERQRVIIARTITQDTNIMILDEPISNIDIQHQIGLLDTIKKLNKEKNLTVIAILHDLNLAAQYSDEIILMNKGKIISFGRIDDVLTKDNIKTVYNLEVNLVKNPLTDKPYIIPVYHQFS